MLLYFDELNAVHLKILNKYVINLHDKSIYGQNIKKY